MSECGGIWKKMSKFATMNQEADNRIWSENVIIVDGEYIDKVAFDLTVNFERMLGRRIPQADLARWVDCVALDGGLRPGGHQTQVVFVHDRKNSRLENFTPGCYEKELNGMAFKDELGEFTLSSFPVEDMVSHDGFLLDILQMACAQRKVRRIMVIANAERAYEDVRRMLRRLEDEDKRITVFAMQPMPGGNFRQEILGYSLMSALGIRGEELGV